MGRHAPGHCAVTFVPILSRQFAFRVLCVLSLAAPLLAQELVFEDWRVTCSAEGEAGHCHMQQTRPAVEGGEHIFQLFIGHEPGAKHLVAVISVPLGVYLANGIEIDIPGRRSLKLPFELCDPTNCYASFELKGAALSSFKRGTEARFRVWLERSKGVEFPVSLRGFSAAHADLTARAIP